MLAQLPLFPLQTVLFPDAYLSLRIFEVRYLDMIGRCHKTGTPFGVVCLTQGSEVQRVNRAAPPSGDAFATEVFHPAGTLAHIEQLERPQPGLMLIRCRAGQRFTLTQHQKLPHGLWVGDAICLQPDPVVTVPEHLVKTRDALTRLLQTLQTQEPSVWQDLPLQPPYRWDDSGWVANRWAELLPVPAEMKQRLMALDNPLVRLELVADVLEQLDPRI